MKGIITALFVFVSLLFSISSQAQTQAHDITFQPDPANLSTKLIFNWTSGGSTQGRIIVLKNSTGAFVPPTGVVDLTATFATPASKVNTDFTTASDVDPDATGKAKILAIISGAGTTTFATNVAATQLFFVEVYEWTGTLTAATFVTAAGVNNPMGVSYYSATSSFSVPTDITSVGVQAWGAGGGGGGATLKNNNSTSGGGGGGGTYNSSPATVTPNASVTVTIGTIGSAGLGGGPSNGGTGGTTTFNSTIAVNAVGGAGGTTGTNGGNGANGAATTGVTNNGGAGTAGSGTAGGAGGGGAGTTGNGQNASGQTGGTGGTGGGGTGPAGSGTAATNTTHNGNSGTELAAGGGGGGNDDTSNGNSTPADGGAGGPGFMIVSYNDITAPTIVSIVRQSPSGQFTNASSITFRVTFNEGVANVDATDFTLAGTGTTGWTISASPAGSSFNKVWDVTVTTSNTSGTGTISLMDGGSLNITDISNNALAAGAITTAGAVAAATYTVDKDKPTVIITATSPQFADPVSFSANFNEAISSFVSGNVTTSVGGGITAGAITVNIPTGNNYPFTVAIASGSSGTMQASIAAGLVSDLAGNTNTISTGNPTVTIQLPPTIQSDIGFTSVSTGGLTVTRTVGNGTNYLLVGDNTGVISWTPVNGVDYTSNLNSNFSAATPIPATTIRVLGIGSGTSFPVTGLTPNTNYHFALFALNGSLTTSAYNTSVSAEVVGGSATTNRGSQQTTACTYPTVAASGLSNSSQAGAMTLNWSATATDGSLVLINQAATASADVPADGTDYSSKIVTTSGNVQFSSAVLSSTGHVVFAGPSGGSPSVKVYGLTPGTAYSWIVYTFNTTGFCYKTPGVNLQNVSTTSTGLAELTMTGPTGVLSTISSLATALSGAIGPQVNATANYSFTVADAGVDGVDGQFNKIVINQGSNNDVVLNGNWDKAISAAQLFDGTTTMAGTINASDITFNSVNPATLGDVPDNSSKTYTLTVALKTAMSGTLPSSIDGKQFEFNVDNSSFTPNAASNSSLAATQSVSSGAAKNVVAVQAVQIGVVTQPSATAVVNVALGTQPKFAAQDQNGNTDLGFGNAITSINTSVTKSGGPATFTSGVADFAGSGFKFTVVGSGSSTIGVTSNSIVSTVTNSVTISSTTTIGAAGTGLLVAGTQASNQSGVAVFGFSLATDGAANTLTGLTITASSDPSKVMSNFRLLTGTGGTLGSSTPVGGGTGAANSTSINTVVFNGLLSGSPVSLNSSATYFYLVADINPFFFQATPSITFSLGTAGFTISLAGGSKSGTLTGPTYNLNDGIAPILTSANVKFTGGINPVYEASLTQTVVLIYNEPMNTATNPLITMSSGSWGSASPSGGTNGWFTTNINTPNDSYKATITQDGTPETFNTVFADVAVGGATDWGTNNIAGAVVSATSFVLDTDKPTATLSATTTATPSTLVNATHLALTVQATYSEAMDPTLPAAAPAITFAPADAHFTPATGVWSVGNTVYTVVFTHDATGEEIPSTIVSIDGGTDSHSNVQTTSAPATAILIDTKVPAVNFINRKTAQFTTGTSVVFLVQFSEALAAAPVSGDFTISITSGTVTGTSIGTITNPSSDGINYEVTVQFNANQTGDIRLDVKSSPSTITDVNGNVQNAGHIGDQIYSVDTTPPTVSSIVINPAIVNGYATTVNGVTTTPPLSYIITFSEPVSGLDPGLADFKFLNAPNAASNISLTPVSVTPVGPSPSDTWKLTETYVSGAGTFEVDYNPHGGANSVNYINGASGIDFLVDGTGNTNYVYDDNYWNIGPSLSDFQNLQLGSEVYISSGLNAGQYLGRVTFVDPTSPSGYFFFTPNNLFFTTFSNLSYQYTLASTVIPSASITGTLSATLGSPAITGTGTLFTTQVLKNDLIFDVSGTVFIGTVLSIPNDNTLNLKLASRTTYSGGFSIHRPPQTFNPAIVDQAGNTITQLFKAGTYGNFCRPEPAAAVTTFTATPANKSITVNWTDVPTADHYLVMLRNKAVVGATPVGTFPVAAPTVGFTLDDGIYFADDTDLTDGLMKLNIAQGVQAATFTVPITGLNSGADYSLIIYPYTLDNNNIVAGDHSAINYNLNTPATILSSKTTISSTTTVTTTSIAAPIPSTVNAPTEQAVFSFKINEDALASGLTDDNSPFKFNEIVILPGSTPLNALDWSVVIAGAHLTNSGNGVAIPGVITGGSPGTSKITFSGLSSLVNAEGYVGDNANKTYTLNISLNTALTDNTVLNFRVDNTSFTTFYDNTSNNQASSQILPSGAGSSTESGGISIDVHATKLLFTTDVQQATIGVGIPFSSSSNAVPVVKAEDANGNLDVNYANAFTITSSLGVTNTSVFSAGVLTLSNFKFTTAGTTTINIAGNAGGIYSAITGGNSATSSSIQAVISSKTLIASGAGTEPGSFPSVTTAQAGAILPQVNAQQNFDFTITDDSGADGTNFIDNDALPTLINTLTITQDVNNGVDSSVDPDGFDTWTNSIAGAELSKVLSGTITSSTVSTAVNGVATQFLTEVAVGAVIKNAAGAIVGTVASITSNILLTLSSNAGVAVPGAAYAISTTGTVAAGSLTFSPMLSGAPLPSNMGYIPDGSSYTYTLRIWLNTNVDNVTFPTLSATIDNKDFVFDITNTVSNITLTGTANASSTLQVSSISSGNTKNKVDVETTQLAFTTEPPTQIAGSYLVSTALSGQPPVPVVEAFDPNNNRDVDYSASITTTCAVGVSSRAVSSQPTTFSSGIITNTVFGSMSIDAIATGAQLTVHSTVANGVGGFPSDAVSTVFDVTVGKASTISTPVAIGPVPSTAFSQVAGGGSTGAVSVFSFNVNDDGAITPNDGNPTLISQIIFRQSTTQNSSALSNWTDAIAGAILSDGNASNDYVLDFSIPANSGYLTLNSITFPNIDFASTSGGHLGYIADSPNPSSSVNSKTYTLKIWLKSSLASPLPISIDGKAFGFDVQSITDITLDPNGTALKSGTALTPSGNTVNVVASKINFMTLAPASTPTVDVNTSVFSAEPPAPFTVSTYIYSPFDGSILPNPPGTANGPIGAEAVDVNGNRDLNYSSAVTGFSANGLTFANDPLSLTQSFSGGTLAFNSNFNYTSGDNQDGKITMSTTVAPALSSTSPTITVLSSLDSYVYFDPSFTSQTFNNFVNQQATSLPATDPNDGTLATMAKLILSDGGGSAFNASGTHTPGDLDKGFTQISDISFSLTGTGVSDLRTIALYDNAGNKISSDMPAGAGVTFTGLSIKANDDLTTTFSIRGTFQQNVGADQDNVQFKVTGVTWHPLGGSKPFNYNNGSGPYFGGVNGGDASLTNIIDVLATSLDFTTLPSLYAGINEPIGPSYTTAPLPSTSAGVVTAHDKFANVDTGFAPTSITLYDDAAFTANPANPLYSLIPPAGGLSFTSGVMNLDGMQYPVAVGNKGKITVRTTGPSYENITGPNGGSSIACSVVNVLDVSVSIDTNNGVLAGTGAPPTQPLKGGQQGVNIFGLNFTANATSGVEPQLKGFTISFKAGTGSNNWYEDTQNSIKVFTNFKVFIGGTANDVTSFISGSSVTPTSSLGNNFLDQVVVALGTPQTIGTGIQFYLVADVDPSTNAGTQSLIPYFVDAGYGTPSDKNSIVTNGTSTGINSNSANAEEFDGAIFSFASTQPPTLRADIKKFPNTKTYPYAGQSNVDPSISTITLEFDTNVGVLDDLSTNQFTGELWNSGSNTKVADLKLNTSIFVTPYLTPSAPAQQGSVVSSTVANVYPKLVFDIVNPLYTPFGNDQVFYVKIRQGSYDPISNVGHGITDFGLNFFGGITDNSTLYFKISSSQPINLNSTVSNFDTKTVGTLTTNFDQLGTAYYLIVKNADPNSPAPTISEITGLTDYLTAHPAATLAASGSYPITAVNIGQTATFSASFASSTSYDVYVFAENNAQPTPIPASQIYSYPALISGIPGTQSSTTPNTKTYTICPDSYVTITDPIVIGETSNPAFFGAGPQDFNVLLPTGFEFDVTVPPNVQLIGSDFSPTWSYSYTSNTVLNIKFSNSGSSSLDYIALSGISIIGKSGTSQGDIQWFYGNNVFSAPPFFSLAKISLQVPKIPDFTNSFWYNNQLGAAPAPFPLISASATSVYNISANKAFNKTVNAIPDNYNDSNNPGAVRLLPMTDPYVITPSNNYSIDNNTFAAGDFLASFYSGSGVSGDLLTLNAVTAGAAFNISIAHTDLNGCATTKKEQYLVYDHSSPISKKLGATLNPSVDASGQSSAGGTKQDIINTNFPNAKANPITSQTILHNELAGYELLQLTADLPSSEIALNTVGKSSQIISGAIWGNLVKNVLNNPVAFTSYNNYSWNYARILNADTAVTSPLPNGIPNVYDFFRSGIAAGVAVPPSGNNFWTGGSLGKIEFTGAYQSTADNSVYVPFRQEVELFVPAVPLIEVASPVPYYDVNDKAPIFNNSVQYPGGYPGAATFCEKGGIITLNAFPVATSTATGKFAIYDYANYTLKGSPRSGAITASNTSSSIVGVGTQFTIDVKIGSVLYDASGNLIGKVLNIADDLHLDLESSAAVATNYNGNYKSVNPLLVPAQTQFVDNHNGSMTLDPTVAAIQNGYSDVMVTYTYRDNISPAIGTGYLVIRVTPNPVASFTVASTVGNPGSSAFDAFCSGSLVSFSSTATLVASSQNYANSIDIYSWDFGDPNSGPSNIASTAAAAHTYTASSTYPVALTLTSHWGCQSLTVSDNNPTTQSSNVLYTGSNGTVKVGDIPVPLFSFLGNCLGDAISFADQSTLSNTNSGTVAINKWAWDFGDGNTGSGNTTSHTYVTSGTFPVKLTAITNVAGADGCQASLSKNLVQLPLQQPTVTGAYQDYFTTSNSGWIALDANGGSGSWAWGQTSNKKNKLFNAGTGSDGLWVTSLSGTYTQNEKSSLYSVCLDLSNLARPMLSYSSFVDLLPNSEGLVLEYSFDNYNVTETDVTKKIWYTLGSYDQTTGLSDGLDWYTAAGLPSSPGDIKFNTTAEGWSGIQNVAPKWIHPKHELDLVKSSSAAYAAANNLPDRAILRFSLSTLTGGLDGVGIDSVFIGSRTRTIMFENFTTTDGGNSTLNGTIAKDMGDISTFNAVNVGTQLVNINYHIGFLGMDPFNLDNPADPSARALYYNIQNVPYAFLDGFHSLQYGSGTDLFGDWGQRAYNLQTLQLAKADFSATVPPVNKPDGSIEVDVNFTPIVDLPPGTTLQVAFVEENVLKTQLPSGVSIGTSEDHFEYVLKKMQPNAAGTKYTSTLPQKVAVNAGPFKWTPEKLYSNQLAVVLFLQNENSKEIYQAELFQHLTAPAPVTAIESIIEGVRIYPNPADQEFTIELPSPAKQNMTLNLANQLGQFTAVGAIREGEQTKKISTQGLAEGVYILQLGSNESALRTKVVVLHK